jgi:putative transposase
MELIGRQAWFQYWDACLTFEKSWVVRLNYVNNNAVHHRLVPAAANYPRCSATWLEQQVDPAFRPEVTSCRLDGLRIRDEFQLWSAATCCRLKAQARGKLACALQDLL